MTRPTLRRNRHGATSRRWLDGTSSVYLCLILETPGETVSGARRVVAAAGIAGLLAPRMALDRPAAL